MKAKIIALISLVFFLGLSGCASMDLEMTKMPMSPDYGKMEARVPDRCIYAPEEQAPPKDEYTVLAKYVVQEKTRVSVSRDPQEMICHAFKDAREKGADAMLVEDIGTKNVAQHARTSAVVKLKAIRFKGDPPAEFFE